VDGILFCSFPSFSYFSYFINSSKASNYLIWDLRKHSLHGPIFHNIIRSLVMNCTIGISMVFYMSFVEKYKLGIF
jgi:hypothetical protein